MTAGAKSNSWAGGEITYGHPRHHEVSPLAGGRRKTFDELAAKAAAPLWYGACVIFLFRGTGHVDYGRRRERSGGTRDVDVAGHATPFKSY